MPEWLAEHYLTLLWAGAGFVALGVGSMIRWAVQDRRALRTQDHDVQRILAGVGRAEEPEPITEVHRWQAWKTTTQPRYADIPAIGRGSGPAHLDPDEGPEEILEEGVEEYIGKHRLPDAVTASYLKAIMTQTQGLPTLRTLSPAWRAS